MYCFPYPGRPNIPPVKVPYVPRLRPDSFTAMLQTHLYFDLASAALLRTVAHEEFFDSEHDGWIDIRVPQWFWLELNTKWNSAESGTGKEVTKLFRSKFEELLSEMRRVLLMQELVDTRSDHEDVSLVLLSVQMLLFVVSRRFDNKMLQSNYCTRSRKRLISRMIENGWCRRRLNVFDTTTTYIPVLYYLSSIQPPESGMHMTCTFERCSVANVLEEPRHRESHCCCNDVGISLPDVCRCLENDQIPLIHVRAGTTGGFELEVVPFANSIPFTAISHVWADRQFGSNKNALPQCQLDYLCKELAKLPRQINDWRFQDYLPSLASSKKVVEPPSNTYQLFWMDTLCIPQQQEYYNLRDKAVNMMNLVYGSANQTLVLDKTLQSLDTGQQPSSLSVGGRASYYGPKDDAVLEMLGELCVSNWMGRAWTLQEAILSRSIVFPTKTSLSYLALCMLPKERWSEDLKQTLRKSGDWLKELLGWKNDRKGLSKPQQLIEPLMDVVHMLLFAWIKDVLQLEQHYEYARSLSGRATKFVDAHKRLQARTTSMPSDVPLILMNLSGLNGNFASTIHSTDERMTVLIYALEILPLELMLLPCPRIRVGPATLDSWIPREIVPLQFDGEYRLKLCQNGFAFSVIKDGDRTDRQDDNEEDLQFFFLPRTCNRKRHFLLSYRRADDKEDSLYWIQTYEHERSRLSKSSKPSAGLFIILIVHGINPKAARFKVSRVIGSTTYLHFDCPLRITYIKGSSKSSAKHLLWNIHPLNVPLVQENLLLERSFNPNQLAIARPQNTVQHEGRLNIAQEWTWQLLYYLEFWLSRGHLKRLCNESRAFLVFWTVFCLIQHQVLSIVMRDLLSRPWIASFRASEAEKQSWHWFWKIWNFRIPTIVQKEFLAIAFMIATSFGDYGYAFNICAVWVLKEDTHSLKVMLAWACFIKLYGWWAR